MPTGAITNYVDVAQLTLYAFWIFFFCLIYYLRREDKREGFPMVAVDGSRPRGFPELPTPKSFLLPHGGVVYAPRRQADGPVLHAQASAGFPGAPLDPVGNPLLSGIGPASYANRRDEAELTIDGVSLIAPLRVALDHSIAAEDPDPRGMEVVAADGLTAGTVTDLWVDRSETIFRYLEVQLLDGSRSVLVPMPFVQFLTRGRIKVRAIRADQFADVPALRDPQSVTLLEEDRIAGYFGGGQLWALPDRMGPVL